MLTLKSNKQSDGFTLIELIIVVAIIGIFSAVAIPSIKDMTDRNRLKNIVETMAQDIQLARSEAVKRNSDIFLTVDESAAWCYGIDSNAAGCDCTVTNSANDAYCDLKRIVSTDFSNISVTAANTNLASVTFTPTGVAQNTGKIEFVSGNMLARLNVNVVGRIRTCSDNISSFVALAQCP